MQIIKTGEVPPPMQSHFENFQASLRRALPYPPKCEVVFACASPSLFSEPIVAEMHQQIKS